MTPLLELAEVDFTYGARAVLRGATLTVSPGEKVGLAGGMGAGKTTLLHLAVGLLRPEQGVVRVFGKARRREADFHEVRRRVGLVFQDADDQLFCPTVLEDVAFGPLNLGLSPASAREAAREALDRVGLPGFENRVTYRLSGGEKRLVALATVLAMHPDVLLLDEPGNGLDADATARIRALLVSLPQSMVIVSHAAAFLDAVATRRLILRDGRIVEQPFAG
jgi:cobalt/nickel transport system ATP-binding protein